MATSSLLNISEGSWLRRHFLTIIALAAFLFMAVLNFEQGRVIDSQRTLVRQLFGDSLSLNNLRATEIVQRQGHEESPAGSAGATARSK